MTSLIEKFLKKISQKDREIILNIFEKIKSRDLVGLDVKKLQGHKDLFRIRKGKMRIVYLLNAEEVKIISVEKRSDDTYSL